jgi:adenylate cyclase
MEESTKRALIEGILNSVRKAGSPGYQSGAANRLHQEKLERELYETINKVTDNRYESVQKQVTILLSDLRGFTAMSEKHQAAELIDLLNRYFHKMSEIILKHGGTIDKFMGDSVMALFGAPTDLEDDLERAIACSVEMQLAMNEINDTNQALGMSTIFMGIGINTGTVFAGNLGSDLHREYTVIGNEVNLASRVEAHSLRGQIVLSENTYQLARDYIEVGTVNDVLVKGVSKKVRLYELLSTQRPSNIEVPRREIRKSARVNVDMPLNFRVVDNKAVQANEREGRIIDISYNGMMISVPTPLTQNTEIRINLSLSMMSNKSSAVYAKVLNIHEDNGAFNCQIEFTYIEDDAQQELKEFVDQIVEYSS